MFWNHRSPNYTRLGDVQAHWRKPMYSVLQLRLYLTTRPLFDSHQFRRT